MALAPADRRWVAIGRKFGRRRWIHHSSSGTKKKKEQREMHGMAPALEIGTREKRNRAPPAVSLSHALTD